MMLRVWDWLRENDIPNWFALFVWPVVLYWWNTRTRQGIPHLEVLLRGHVTTINGQQFDAVELVFTNRTGCVAYVSRARLRERKKHFPIPPAAVGDISNGWRELKFQKVGTLSLIEDECILQTNDRRVTNIAVSQQMDQAFYDYRPKWVRRWLWWPKYFRLQYTAMIADKRYLVDTVY
ncbi:MAG: hypothetical protein WAM77_19225 [Xanthobacteraceae bacterium]